MRPDARIIVAPGHGAQQTTAGTQRCWVGSDLNRRSHLDKFVGPDTSLIDQRSRAEAAPGQPLMWRPTASLKLGGSFPGELLLIRAVTGWHKHGASLNMMVSNARSTDARNGVGQSHLCERFARTVNDDWAALSVIWGCKAAARQQNSIHRSGECMSVREGAAIDIGTCQLTTILQLPAGPSSQFSSRFCCSIGWARHGLDSSAAVVPRPVLGCQQCACNTRTGCDSCGLPHLPHPLPVPRPGNLALLVYLAMLVEQLHDPARQAGAQQQAREYVSTALHYSTCIATWLRYGGSAAPTHSLVVRLATSTKSSYSVRVMLQ